MVRYFYAWTPAVIVVSAVLLALPWLGLIALMVFALAALAALAALVWAVVAVPLALSRAVGRRWREHGHVDRAQPVYVAVSERRSGAMR
jgi:hypothetical protein